MKKLLILIFAFLALQLNAQNSAKAADPINEAVVNLYSQLLIYPQEKIYIQTDRPYYITGEKIFFRAYLLNASQLAPATYSRYVYVELISPVNKLVVRTKVRLDENNLFYGALVLPETLPEGNYRIRAYTRFMENLGEANYFTRSLYIAEAKSANTTAEVSFDFKDKERVQLAVRFSDNRSDVILKGGDCEIEASSEAESRIMKPDDYGFIRQTYSNKELEKGRVLLVKYRENSNLFYKYISVPFEGVVPELSVFPEGGAVVPEQENRFGFKALLPDGSAARVSGVVVDSKGKEVSRLETLHEGMGSFLLQVNADETYKAKYSYEGKNYETSLPAAKANAVALQVNREADSIALRLLSGKKPLENEYFVLVHRQGVPLYFQAWNPEKTTLRWSKAWFVSGVTHLMLLNSNFEPLSERLVFNNRNDAADVQIAVDAKVYKKREKVSLDISLPSAASDTIFTSYSLVVTDDKDVIPDTTTNIMAEILLTSELRGHIEYPAYYFEGGEQMLQAADLLMLTHGWRRYHVEEALKNDLKRPEIQPETSQQIAGLLKNKQGRPFKNGFVKLTAVGGNFTESLEADEAGRFEFSDLEFPENTAFQLMGVTPDGTDKIEVHPDKEVFPSILAQLYSPENAGVKKEEETLDNYLTKATRKYVLENGMLQMDLDELYVVARAKEKLERMDNKVIPTAGDRWLSPTQLRNEPPATFDDLFWRIPGVVNVSPDAGVTFNAGTARIIVDGIEREYIDVVGMLDVSEVGQVDVYLTNQAVLTRWQPAKAVVVISTWDSSTWGSLNKPNGNLLNVLPIGYQLPVEFYSPKYETAEERTDAKEDLRSTIYWKPNVLTHQDAKTKLEFYTADTPGSYSVTIEGVGPGRKLIYKREKGLVVVE